MTVNFTYCTIYAVIAHNIHHEIHSYEGSHHIIKHLYFQTAVANDIRAISNTPQTIHKNHQQLNVKTNRKQEQVVLAEAITTTAWLPYETH